MLAEKCHVIVAHSTLVEFAQRRMRPKPPEAPKPVPLADKSQGMFDGGWSKMSREEKDAVRERHHKMREEARNRKPVPPVKIEFFYDETQPLVLPPKEEWTK